MRGTTTTEIEPPMRAALSEDGCFTNFACFVLWVGFATCGWFRG